MRIRSSYQHHPLLVAAVAFAASACFCGLGGGHNTSGFFWCDAFVANVSPAAAVVTAGAAVRGRGLRTPPSPSPLFYNIYDNWRSDATVDTMHLDEDNVRACLDEFVASDYGTTMFGCHDRAASVGITGEIGFVEVCGPEVTLSLEGRFWHRRSTVLGRAAVWLNARIPEITDVMVADLEDLEDFEEIRDETSGDVLFRKDKRSEDFNGDRATMEYQGCVRACVRACFVWFLALALVMVGPWRVLDNCGGPRMLPTC